MENDLTRHLKQCKECRDVIIRRMNRMMGEDAVFHPREYNSLQRRLRQLEEEIKNVKHHLTTK